MSTVSGRLAFGENDGPVRGTVLCQCIGFPIRRGKILVKIERMAECGGCQSTANRVDAERDRRRHGVRSVDCVIAEAASRPGSWRQLEQNG